MSRVFKVNRGRKRAVQRVRWKRADIINLILLVIGMSVLSVLLALWLASHHFD